MKIEIAWKKLNNVQTKKFEDETACIEWCRKNSENIMSINGIITEGRKLSHFDIMDCLKGRQIDISSISAANAFCLW